MPTNTSDATVLQWQCGTGNLCMNTVTDTQLSVGRAGTAHGEKPAAWRLFWSKSCLQAPVRCEAVAAFADGVPGTTSRSMAAVAPAAGPARACRCEASASCNREGVTSVKMYCKPALPGVAHSCSARTRRRARGRSNVMGWRLMSLTGHVRQELTYSAECQLLWLAASRTPAQ